MTFPFRRSRLAVMSRLFGVRAEDAYVEVTDDQLSIRFGPWRLSTPINNVAGASITGPYQWWKVAGPPHLSFGDRGITFGTATDRGVCITFHEPVPAIMPGQLIRHPGATVTVDDADHLVNLLDRAS